MISWICETMRGMSPSVGSSRRMILGSSIMARAMASICCSPPDSVPPAWPRRSPSTGKAAYTLSSRSFFLASVTPARSSPVRRFSITLSSLKMRRSSGTQAMPRCATWWEAIPPISRPSKVTCPSDGRTSPITVLSVVLLPTPLRPSSDRHPVENVGLAVIGVDVVQDQHQVFRYTSWTRGFAWIWAGVPSASTSP